MFTTILSVNDTSELYITIFDLNVKWYDFSLKMTSWKIFLFMAWYFIINITNSYLKLQVVEQLSIFIHNYCIYIFNYFHRLYFQKVEILSMQTPCFLHSRLNLLICMHWPSILFQCVSWRALRYKVIMFFFCLTKLRFTFGS